MNINYTGPIKDYSGYGESNRNYLAALMTAGVKVIPQVVSYSVESSDFGSLGDKIAPLFKNHGSYKIKILHITPNEYKRFIEPGVYHIGHFFWETDLVPKDFADGLQLMNEIWTGSQANADAIKKAGVTKPIYIFPQAIEIDREWFEPYELPGFSNGYLFYSIFEWTDKKNPAALLNAYWSAFQDGENVALLIKTYFRNFTLGNKRMIKHQIDVMKRRSGLEKFPRVFVYFDLMDRHQISRLHNTGDVYVSAHCGEGWGIPQVEAALAGKPMISTGWSGCHEYFDKNNAILLPYSMEPLSGMNHSDRWYNSAQNWAVVDRDAMTEAFRFAYKSPDVMKSMGARAQEMVRNNFNFETVGKALSGRLKTIEKGFK